MGLLTWSVHAICQDHLEPYTPLKYNEAGHSYIEEDQDYLKAEAEFSKIHPNDTLYNQAFYNRIVCFKKAGEFEKGIRLAKEGLKMDSEYIVDTHLNYIWCLDSLGRKADAYAALDEAQRKFPYNYDLTKAKAPMLEADGEYEEAFNIYKKCIEAEPLNPSHHLSMAGLVSRAGAISHTVLALAAALILEPESDNNLAILQASNSLVSTKSKTKPKFNLERLTGDDFQDIDELVTNYIALDDSYKVPSILQFSTIKQLYLIITESEMDKGFFSQTYLKPLKKIVDQNNYKELSTLVGLISDSEEHQKFVAANVDDIIAVRGIFTSMLETTAEKVKAPQGLTDQDVDYMFFDDGKLRGMCHYNAEKDILTGPSIFFNRLGTLQRKGSYDQNGKMTGDWKWYHENGQVSRKSKMNQGMVNGETIFYNDRGGINSIVPYKNDEVEGVVENYKLIGYKYEDAMYKNGQMHGQTIGYYPNQSKQYEYMLKEGKYDGPFKLYYEDGNIREEGVFKNDLFHGMRIRYYRNGNVDYFETYNEGELDGPYQSLFQDGSVYTKGNFRAGNKLGEWKEFDASGVMVQIEEYDEKGKVNGPTKHLDHRGRIETEYIKKKGDIVELINYGPDGEVISKYKRKGKTLKFENQDVHGNIRLSGQFVDDNREGEWKFYDSYGNLNRITQYEKGLKNGVEKRFYSNDVLYSKTTYVNDKKNGLETTYFSNGNLSYQAYYKNDQNEGRAISYTSTGQLSTDYYYMNGVQVGENKYYNPDGKPYLMHEFDAGYVVAGERYDPSGNVSSNFILEEGRGEETYYFYVDQKEVMGRNKYFGSDRDEAVERYHRDGSTRMTGSYANGEYHGEWINYHHNGKKKKNKIYEYGVRTGKWQSWDLNGNLTKTQTYKYDRLDGPSTRYLSNGKIKDEYNYNNGIISGPAEFYNSLGELQFSFIYENGLLTSYTYHDKDGKLKEPIPLEKGTGHIIGYFPNGEKSIDFKIKSGVIVGELLSYYSDGGPAEKLNYNNGYLDGPYYTYHSNGKVLSEQNYSLDQKHGVQKFNYPNGNLEREENWLTGEQHGLTVEYDDTGKETISINYVGDIPYDYK